MAYASCLDSTYTFIAYWKHSLVWCCGCRFENIFIFTNNVHYQHCSAVWNWDKAIEIEISVNLIPSKKIILCASVLKMLEQKDHTIWPSSNVISCYFILQIVQLDTLFGLPFAKMEVLPWNDLFGFVVNCFSKQMYHLTPRKNSKIFI